VTKSSTELRAYVPSQITSERAEERMEEEEERRMKIADKNAEDVTTPTKVKKWFVSHSFTLSSPSPLFPYGPQCL
jgi:hypothetical protein